MTVQQDEDFDQLISDNADHFASGARGAQLRWCEEAIFAEGYDAAKWTVRSRADSWTFAQVFDAIQVSPGDAGTISSAGKDDLTLWAAAVQPPTSGIKLGTHTAYRVSATEFTWNDYTFKIKNYKGKDIPIPDDRMWGWFEQRKIKVFKLKPDADDNQDFDEYDRVVFGTKTDHYTAFPEKYGFKGRRAIASEDSWKTDKYENRLRARNPRRGQRTGKWTKGVSGVQKQNRWDEINEESGLRVKHAPCILMKNQFITDQDSFIKMYLYGSQGTADPLDPRARPEHVTDHEIYRMFAGKYRQNILDNSLFADVNTRIIKVGKRHNHWYNKNQISRSWRIRNQN